MSTAVSFPARCAVAVICGEHLVSQVYPAGVPVEVFVDGVVDLINDDLKRRGEPGLDAGLSYELLRTNGSRLDITKTLDELGVEDGATLVLAPAEDGDSFEPHYEALSTGLAHIGRALFPAVTAVTAANTALAIVAMVAVTVAALTLYSRAHQQSWAPVAGAILIGVALGAGAGFVRRGWPDRHDLIDGLSWSAVPPLCVGAAAAPPGTLGAAQLFIGSLGAAILVGGLCTVTQRHLRIAAVVVTLAVLAACVAGVRMFVPASAQVLGLGVLVALLLLLTLAPTIALWAARIRPPHFGSITGRDLFRRVDGMSSDAVAPVDEGDDEEPNPDSTPPGERIAAAARRANSVLTGICVAAATALPVAVWATLAPGQPRGWAAALLSAIFVLIFIIRARGFTDRRQAVALVCGAAAAVCAGVGRYVVHDGGRSPATTAVGILILAGFAAAGLAAALLVPATRFTPLVRMLAEWIELAAIVVALPLAAWIGGLFAWVRMR